jgi:hypothetical protein
MRYPKRDSDSGVRVGGCPESVSALVLITSLVFRCSFRVGSPVWRGMRVKFETLGVLPLPVTGD